MPLWVYLISGSFPRFPTEDHLVNSACHCECSLEGNGGQADDVPTCDSEQTASVMWALPLLFSLAIANECLALRGLMRTAHRAIAAVHPYRTRHCVRPHSTGCRHGLINPCVVCIFSSADSRIDKNDLPFVRRILDESDDVIAAVMGVRGQVQAMFQQGEHGCVRRVVPQVITVSNAPPLLVGEAA